MWPVEEGINHVIGGGRESSSQMTKALLCSPKELEIHPKVPEGSSPGDWNGGGGGGQSLRRLEWWGGEAVVTQR